MGAPKIVTKRSQLLPLLLIRLREAGEGAEAEALVARYGLTLDDADTLASMTVPVDVHRIVCERVAHVLHDPFVGLHVAIEVRSGAYGIVEFAARSSPTLLEALERLIRYGRLLSDILEVAFDANAGRAVITHGIAGEIEAAGRHANEYALARILRFGREASGLHIVPLEVAFAHAAPDDVSELVRWFGTSHITFDRPANRIVVAREVMDARVMTSDGPLLAFLDREAEQRLPPAGPSSEVRRQIAALLAHAEPTLEAVAAKLHMSARTLQRRLGDNGTTFQAELDAVRRELAAEYLADPRLGLFEIAARLRYAETRTFERAFRRWHGVSVKAYRARIAQ